MSFARLRIRFHQDPYFFKGGTRVFFFAWVAQGLARLLMGVLTVLQCVGFFRKTCKDSQRL